MLRLCLKDLLILKWYPLVGLASYALYVPIVSGLEIGYVMISAVFTLLLVLGAVIVEDRCEAEPLLCCLPVERRTIVLARYLSSFLAIVIGLALCLAIGRLQAALFGLEEPQLRLFMTPEGIVTFVLVLSLLVSILLPPYFKFGLGRAVIVVMAVIVVGLIVLSVTLHLAGLVGWIGPTFRAPGVALIRAVIRAREAVGATALVALAAVLTAACVSLSLALSLRFFRARDF